MLHRHLPRRFPRVGVVEIFLSRRWIDERLPSRSDTTLLPGLLSWDRVVFRSFVRHGGDCLVHRLADNLLTCDAGSQSHGALLGWQALGVGSRCLLWRCNGFGDLHLIFLPLSIPLAHLVGSRMREAQLLLDRVRSRTGGCSDHR